MKVTTTEFKDLYILEPKVLQDNRGYFLESYNRKTFSDNNFDLNFVQDNQSFSVKGALRGMHFQRPPFAQTKLVRVLQGVIQDVVIDLRKDQPTFKKYFSIKLSSENKKQLLVPKGFAHGLLVLSDTADVLYKCDEHYYPDAEGGVFFNDPEIGIKWEAEDMNVIVSKKDGLLPLVSSSYLFAH
ncbi:dTDP-4-dehydrorhamnose 3,5-epimerase [soil metagenome]